jgi:hypothetical protein
MMAKTLKTFLMKLFDPRISAGSAAISSMVRPLSAGVFSRFALSGLSDLPVLKSVQLRFCAGAVASK